jgi:subtilisin-like proprotein convertase family protein
MRTAVSIGLLVGLLTACGGGDSQALLTAPAVPTEVPGPDPLLSQQWHLFNTGQGGGLPGIDLGLQGVAETGQGVLIAFVDGAVQISHPDLVANLHTVKGFLTTPNPSPPFAPADAPYNDRAGEWDDAHGTAVVGIAVARADNSIGGRGVAPQAKFLALDGLSNGRVGQALVSALDQGADIVNNSWGFLDPQAGQGRSYQRADPLWREALGRALSQGRQGRGAVVVFAAGNGGADDDSNRDGYANQPGVLAVGAVDHTGRPPTYAEPGANVLVSAPSMSLLRRAEGGADIWTTDLAGPRGLSGGTQAESADYAAFAGGTSASAPMVSGVVALMLQANPALSWRDVRWLLARTARAASLGAEAAEPSVMNSHGYHPMVGFGRVHAGDSIAAARVFRGLPAERRCDSGLLSIQQNIGDAPDAGLSLGHRFSVCNLSVLESVEVTVQAEHAYGADLQIELNSPTGHRSVLARPHFCSKDFTGGCGDFSQGWTFHSVRHMGENAAGNWRLRVQDLQEGDTGRLLQWRLVLTGH